MNDRFLQELGRTTVLVNEALAQLVTDRAEQGETVRPQQLVVAMSHGLLNGGKRLRPFLVIQSAALFGVTAERAMLTACALECLHSYSLIHDDLPAMDDDDLRRGKPTVHKAYDEATAILAGDALLTLSFDLLTRAECHPEAGVRCRLVSELARASGLGGMIGGQVLDMTAEKSQPDDQQVRLLQSMKTGALIRFACCAGAILGQANDRDYEHLSKFGETIGLAFQLADDLLDVTSNAKTMGKAVGKDAERGKATLVSIHGVDKTQILLAEAVESALHSLAAFGERAEILHLTARYMAQRSS
ncbi:MAG: polyprenyl synthetase family protein [Rhizobiaceae bacterium]